MRIKANDNDNWNGTAPRIRTVSVTCSSTTGNTAQGIRFHVASDGRLTLTSGVIDNSGYTVTSAALLTTACGAPSACSVSATLAEGNVTLTWSGASGGTSAIKGYMIASRTSTDNSAWSAWSVLATITLAASGGSFVPVVSRVPGTYTQFGVWTIDAFDVYSSERVSGSIHCVSAACDEPAVAAPKAGSSTYGTRPYLLISTGAQPDEQVVCVKIDSGDWQDSVNNPELFSAGGTVGKNTGVIFRPAEQAPGEKL